MTLTLSRCLRAGLGLSCLFGTSAVAAAPVVADANDTGKARIAASTVQFSAIGSSASPVAVGAPLTVSWKLAPPFGAPPLTFGGTVTVTDAPDCASPPSDPAHLCSAVLPASACALSFTTPGTRTLTLCYPGDGAALPASATLTQPVSDGVATTTSITQMSASDVAPFAPVTVTVSVAETPAQNGNPAGVVEVFDGPPQDLFASHCRIHLHGTSGETGSCTFNPTQAGRRTVSARFAAQGRWSASAASTPLVVGQLRFTRASPNPSRRGQGASIMVDLDVSPFLGQPAPGDLIVVQDGPDGCFVMPPANYCDWSSSTAGVHALNAIWYGDANYGMRLAWGHGQLVIDAPIELVTTGTGSIPSADGAAAGAAFALSANGRYAVFLSDATMFAQGDTNGIADVFVRDQKNGSIRRANTSSRGEQANGTSATPAISANGRYVVFSSLASNLVPGDTNLVRDVFLKDLVTDSTVRVSLNADGSQATTDNEFSGMPTSISADGRYVAFLTFARLLPRDTNSHSDVYVKDLLTGELDLVSTASDESPANFRNDTPAISADGRYVAFASQASNFVPQDTSVTQDIYLKDRVTRSIRLVSANAAGTAGGSDASSRPVVSADGRYVAFQSAAHDLIVPDTDDADIYVRDLQSGTIARANTDAAGAPIGDVAELPSISADGRYVAFQSTLNATTPTTRILIKDRQTGQIARGDVALNGSPPTSGSSFAPALSADGRFVSFYSAGSSFTAGDINGLADLFVRDLAAATNQRAALENGIQSDGASGEAMLSRDGQYVVFSSAASNLVTGDSGGWRDIFVYDRNARTTERVSRGRYNIADADSDSPFLSADNQWIAFRSFAGNLVFGDFNNGPDIFIRQPATNNTYLVSVSSASQQPVTGTMLGPVSVNADATLIAFRATDSTLVPGDTNGAEDVFVHSRNPVATRLASASAGGAFGNGHSTQALISDDGSRAAFTSLASNLVADDTNGVSDVYVKLLGDDSIVRASSTSAGAQGNGASSDPTLSGNGRYVAFASAANNLVAGDTNGRIDVFVKDLQTGGIVRANLGAAGQQGSGGDCSSPSLSADATRIGFLCAQTGLVDGIAPAAPQGFVKNLQTGFIYVTTYGLQGLPANAAILAGPRALSDGGLHAFTSGADNLGPGDAPQLADVFVGGSSAAQRTVTQTTIASHAPNPSQPGEPYSVTVSVARSGGGGGITGTVTVTDGGARCEATLAGGGNTASGSCTITPWLLGNRQLVAYYDGDAAHAPSVSAAVTHAILAPVAPTAPFIGTVTRDSGQIVVAFQPPADAGTHPLDGYTASCGSATQTGSGSPIVVPGLANGTAVSCRVRASSAAGTGPWSEPSARVTPATFPSVPTNAVATRSGSGQLSIAFVAPSNDGGSTIAGYYARCGAASAPGTASPIIVGGLTNGVAVTCRVAAVNDVGEGLSSAPSASITPLGTPAAPAGVVATRGNTQVSVAFAAPPDDGGSAVTGYVASCGIQSQNGTASPIVVSGLANGTPVSCRVAASNAIGTGAWSAVSNTVTPATQPAAPLLLSANGTPDGTGAVLTFGAPDNGGSAITGYDAICQPNAQTANGASSPLTVSGLAAGTMYTCSVSARNELGAGDASDGLAVTPRIQVDLAITNSNDTDFLQGGSDTAWLMAVTNGSPRGVTGARVRTTLPAHLSDIAWVCSADGGAACPAASGSGTIDVLVDLPAGATATFLLSAAVPALPETPVQTAASVSVNGTFEDPQPGNDGADDGPDAVGIFRSGFQ